MPHIEELITARQAASVVGKSPRTIARLAEAGRLRIAQKLPGRTGGYLFERNDVEALADELARSAS